jgi:hypothetical protein
MIAEAKQSIDLASIVESAGVELVRRGTRHVGLCPFHDEKTPSFYIYDDGGFYCFGCHEGGDAISFVQKMYGLSFSEALRYLGIERRGSTPQVRRDIQRRKRRAELVKAFRKWEIQYYIYVSDLHFRTKKLMMNGIPPEDLNLYSLLLHALPVWKYHMEILIHGDDNQKYQLFKEVGWKL